MSNVQCPKSVLLKLSQYWSVLRRNHSIRCPVIRRWTLDSGLRFKERTRTSSRWMDGSGFSTLLGDRPIDRAIRLQRNPKSTRFAGQAMDLRCLFPRIEGQLPWQDRYPLVERSKYR